MKKRRVTWHAAKAVSNLRKHRVPFEEAQTVLDDPDVLIKPDLGHSETDDRAQAVGLSSRLRVLFVVFVEMDDDVIRIISARRATSRESETYGNAKEKH